MAAALLVLLTACSETAPTLNTGYYTAESTEFDELGWKQFVTIYVSSGKIITVEYNAKNASGLLKSWDMHYMRVMNSSSGTYPSHFARAYSNNLLNRQEASSIDVVTGATYSHDCFQLLANAAIVQSQNGDSSIAFVDLPIYSDYVEDNTLHN